LVRLTAGTSEGKVDARLDETWELSPEIDVGKRIDSLNTLGGIVCSTTGSIDESKDEKDDEKDRTATQLIVVIARAGVRLKGPVANLVITDRKTSKIGREINDIVARERRLLKDLEDIVIRWHSPISLTVADEQVGDVSTCRIRAITTVIRVSHGNRLRILGTICPIRITR
jgi:hypothetical protein